MQKQDFPTVPEMYEHAVAELDAARSALADASSWLRSDWRPLGSPLPKGVGVVLREVTARIERLKDDIDEPKGELRFARCQTVPTSSDTGQGS